MARRQPGGGHDDVDDRSRALLALRVPNFRTWFAGQVLSFIGTWMQSTAQVWLVLDLTDSGSALGVTIALQFLPILLLGPYAGVVADRVDNRRLLLLTSAVGSLQAATVGVLVVSGHATIGAVWALALVLGLAAAFERPTFAAMLTELVGPAELSSAVGLNNIVNASGRLIGPALAALVIEQWGLGPCFFVNAISFGAVIGALVVMRQDQLRPRRDRSGRGSLREGFRAVRADVNLKAPLIAASLVGIMVFNFVITMPSMVRFAFHRGPGLAGVAQSISGVGSVFGGLLVSRSRRPSLAQLGRSSVFLGATMAAMAASPNPFVFVAVMPVLGTATALFIGLGQVVLQHAAAPELQGRVQSLYTVALLGSTPIGGLLMGWIIEAGSPRAAVGVGAVTAVLTGLVLVIQHPAHPRVGLEVPA